MKHSNICHRTDSVVCVGGRNGEGVGGECVWGGGGRIPKM